MTHPHAPPEATPRDAGFLRFFFMALAALLLSVAAFTLLIDPLGRFGTGLLPPVVTGDRDAKARLYQARHPRPQLVVLGSSRSKTIAPSCLTRLTGQTAFNFAVNGARSEDLVAILRFIQAVDDRSIRTIVVGLEPEMLQSTGGANPGLLGSRALGPFAPGAGAGPPPVADLLGWQAVSAAVRSAVAGGEAGGAPETVLDPDGLQRYPRAEAEVRAGTFEPGARISGSIAGILGRYESFPALDSTLVRHLRDFLVAARRSTIVVTAFIPPVHPALARRAEQTAWRPRTEETVALLRGFERERLLRYVETRTLPVDTTRFVDAIHFLAPVAASVTAAVTGRSDPPCALQ